MPALFQLQCVSMRNKLRSTHGNWRIEVRDYQNFQAMTLAARFCELWLRRRFATELKSSINAFFGVTVMRFGQIGMATRDEIAQCGRSANARDPFASTHPARNAALIRQQLTCVHSPIRKPAALHRGLCPKLSILRPQSMTVNGPKP